MTSVSRRKLLSSAILAGAGATAIRGLGRFDPAKAATDPDVDPNFLMGQVVKHDSAAGIFQVLDLDLQVRTARLMPASRVWKQGAWSSVPLALNDCVMSRGTLNAKNDLLISNLWVDIKNFRGELSSVSASAVTFGHAHGSSKSRSKSVTATVNSRTEVNAGGQVVTGSTKELAPGHYVNVIGYGEPSAGTFVATLIIGPAADTGPEPAPVVRAGPGVTNTTYEHIASWFCCGNVSSACGADCANSGGGACGDCRADRLHMAWSHLSTTGCDVDCCGNCCRTHNSVACGHSVAISNPCLGHSATATVHDCGPCVHCISNFGCDNRNAVAIDLTPCSFTALGGTLQSGLQTCNATI